MKAGDILSRRFQVVCAIGSGGIGEVFEATDLQTGGVCAIKVLRPRYARDPKIRRRFMREARAVGRLKHPGVVRLLTYGVDDDTAFIAMERLHGRTLEALRDEGADWATIEDVLDQCLAALAYSHARGVVHRDFKPANVFLVDGPLGLQVKLLDFGFARVEEDDDPDLTQVHRDAFGTPHYMAPEQASGEGTIGPPTDIYSVGAVLYELVCGAPPFTGRTAMAVAFKQIMEAAPALQPRPELRLPEGVEGIIQRALAKAPRDRYANATEMRHALAALRGGPGVATLGRPPVEVAGPDADVTVVSTTTGVLAPAEAVAPAIAGREAEMGQLWQRVRSACTRGRGAVIVIESGEGMGGPQLVGWLRDQVAEGGWMQVVHGQAGRLAYHGHGALRAAIEALFGGLPSDGVAAAEAVEQAAAHWHRAPGRQATVERVALSALAAYLRPGDAVGVPKGLRGGPLFERATSALRLAASERPVLLLFDDVDRAGPAVSGFLRALAIDMAERPMPVLAVATTSSAAAAPDSAIEHLRLGPLGPDALVDLLDEAAPIDPGLARAVAGHANGNPLFAVELLTELRRSGAVRQRAGVLEAVGTPQPATWPETLGEALLIRALGTLGDLPDGRFLEQALLRAAVLGPDFDYGVLLDYLVRAGAPGRRAEWAIEAMLQVQLLVEARDRRADRLHFAHEALQVAGCDAAARRGEPVPLLHRLAAEAKEAWIGNRRPVIALELAEHYQQARAPLPAAACLVEAAEAAGEAGEQDHAVRLLDRADRLLGGQSGPEAARRRAEVWLALAALAFEAGDHNRTRRLLAQVDKWTRQTRDLVVAARARTLLADLLLALGDIAQAGRIYANAARLAEGAQAPRLQALACLGRARAALQSGRPDAALGGFRLARDLLVPLGDPVTAAPAWMGLGGLALEGGTPGEARLALEAALDGFRRGGDWAGRARCHLLLAEVAQRHEGPNRVQAHLDEALAAYAGLGDRGGLARTHERLARLHAEQGHWGRAREQAQRAISAFEALGQPVAVARVRRTIGALAVASGQLDLGRELVDAALAAVTHPDAALVLHALAGWAAGEAGDLAVFQRHLKAAWKLGRGGAVADIALAQALEGSARVSAQQGDRRAAARLMLRAAAQYDALEEPGEAERARRAAGALDPQAAGQGRSDPPAALQTPPPAALPPVTAEPVGRPVHRAVGCHIGNLKIVEQIASGGMGAIFLARHTALDTPYAVKLLHPAAAAEPTMVARFRREAVTCSRLRHPNVVFLTDFGLDPELGIYLVMEYLAGDALSALLDREERLSVDRALALADQICQALAAAHRLGIIHRDLKPENLMVVPDGEGGEQLKVLDFGIVRLQGKEAEKLTGAGLVLGTPEYMAPEQISGKTEQLGPATDVYALGAVLFEMLAGRPPFLGKTDFQVLSQHLLDAVPRVSVHRPDLDDTQLDALLGRMLSKDHTARPQSMDVVRTALIAARRELVTLGVVDERETAVETGTVPDRVAELLERLAAGPGATAELAARLPELGGLSEGLLQRTLWGVLQGDVLELEQTEAAVGAAGQHAGALLGAALEAADEAEGEATYRAAQQGLQAVLRLCSPARQKGVLQAIQGLRSHPRFPEEAVPEWARVSSSGTWRLPGLPTSPPGAVAGIPPSTLAGKLARPLSFDMVKSVLTHEISLFGKRKGG